MLLQKQYKIVVVVFLAVIAGLNLMAQIPPDYPPAPSPATNINNIEYFFDSKPQFGSGIVLTGFTPSTNINAFIGTVDLSSLSTGFHRIYIRSKDENGKWSITNSAFFDNYNLPLYASAPATPGNITQLEYFIDSNPGFGNGTQIPITPGTDISGLNANINITGLLQGVHRFYIQSKDANGKWSITNLGVFDNSSIAQYPGAPAAPSTITSLEYYIDTDPGFGNATPLSVPVNSGDINNYSVNLNLSGSLATGTHYLYIRSKENPWSLSNVVPFNASSTLPVNWLYVRAFLQNNDGIISWATSSETNTDRFEIEHSGDGNHFIKVGSVRAATISTLTVHYSFTHPGLIQGMNYYRIKQIDLDGNYKYSAVVTLLNRKDLRHTIIAPNPVTDLLHIIEPAQIKIIAAEIYNSAGVQLIRKSINDNVQVHSLPVNTLLPGVYHVRIIYENEIKTLSFIKQ